MKYVPLDYFVYELKELRDYVSIFESEQFDNIIHKMKTDKDIGVLLPSCDTCKNSLRDYKGVPRVCTSVRREDHLLGGNRAPMAICDFYEEDGSK